MQSSLNPTSIHYHIATHDTHAHLYHVNLEIAQPATTQHVSLPVWVVGSYLVREFAKHLQDLQVTQGERVLQAVQVDKCSWQIDCLPEYDANAALPLSIRYSIYALDESVRGAWLDAERGFFNPTCLCLRVEGKEDNPHSLSLSPPTTSTDTNRSGNGLPWCVATGATLQKHSKHKAEKNTTNHDAHPHATANLHSRGFGVYLFKNYDELLDSPFEMGTFWRGQFKSKHGVVHEMVVTGALPSLDAARLLQDTKAICETQWDFWHDTSSITSIKPIPPFKRYVFLINAHTKNYGGLEHRNSTALVVPRADLPRIHTTPVAEYAQFLGLISHEYFHTWNVKRLRPFELVDIDYNVENYTELLWFFEGFTSYFDDLLLCRAKCIDVGAYIQLLQKTIQKVQSQFGRNVQTVAQSSFDAWTKYYRPDANSGNATTNYYTKGSLVALCLDLSLRQETNHTVTLNHVMRALWQRCTAHGSGDKSKNGGMRERDLLLVLEELTERDWTPQLQQWVHGTQELPLQSLLEKQGILMKKTAPDHTHLSTWLWCNFGLQMQSTTTLAVLRHSAAEQAGFCVGDVWLSLEYTTQTHEKQHNTSTSTNQHWHIQQTSDIALHLSPLLHATYSGVCTAWVARNGRVLPLVLVLQTTKTTPATTCATDWTLHINNPMWVERWVCDSI